MRLLPSTMQKLLHQKSNNLVPPLLYRCKQENEGKKRGTWPIASLSRYSLSILSAWMARGFLILWRVVLLFRISKHLEQLAPMPSTVNEKKSNAPLKGCTMNPKKAWPSPCARPRTPFCRALSTGFLRTPDMPKATPCARASVPCMIPSPNPPILLDHTWLHFYHHFKNPDSKIQLHMIGDCKEYYLLWTKLQKLSVCRELCKTFAEGC